MDTSNRCLTPLPLFGNQSEDANREQAMSCMLYVKNNDRILLIVSSQEISISMNVP